jgi:membrane associated rhomboid family serine protease
MAFIPIYDTNPLRNIRRPWVAWVLIAVNVLVFFGLQGGLSGEASEASVDYFGLIPGIFTGAIQASDAEPDWITILSWSFLHADIWHLLGNMIFLWVLADNVEDALGHFRFFVFYILCGIAAGYASVLTAPASNDVVIGASGAVAGVVTAYVILTPRAKIWVLAFEIFPVRLSAMWVLGWWIVFQIIEVIAGDDSGVAWWAHIGGIAAGAILVVVMRQKGVPLFGPVASPAPAPVGPPPPVPVPIVPAAAVEPPIAKGPWA